VDGNKFGGQILVKVCREKTKNPQPIGSRKILFNKSSSDENDLKSKLFKDINNALKEQGKDPKFYEEQAPIGKKKLQI